MSGMDTTKTCSTCKYSKKGSTPDYPLACKKSAQDIYITCGWGIEVTKGVRPDDTCKEWRKK